MSLTLENTILWTALVTPLTENGEIDREGLRNLIKEQEAAKNGLLLLGSTGEALNLSLNARLEVLKEAALADFDGPIMVGVGGNELASQKSWMNQVKEIINPEAFLLVVPHYAKPGIQGQILWFKELLDHAGRPCMLYNVPGRTAMDLKFDALKELVKHKNTWSLKEASGSPETCQKYVEIMGEKPVLCGDDALFPAFVDAGAKGLVSVAGNSWPIQTNLYAKKALEKLLTQEEVQMWKEASESLFLASNPTPVKRLLFEDKRIASAELELPLTSLDLTDWSSIMNHHQKIKSWKAE